MRTVEWHDGCVRMIDQTKLPWSLKHVELNQSAQVVDAIQRMVVRGAPAIGAAAAFGMALAALEFTGTDPVELQKALQRGADLLKGARPTASNLEWAVERMLQAARNMQADEVGEVQSRLIELAQQIADEDVAINKRMAGHGASLIKDGDTILHHCNTGALATVDWGTALGVIRSAHRQGKRIHVLLDETRPRLQGGRLSAWELAQEGISFEVIPDSSAGHFMQRGEVQVVLVGADRVAANGDVANKIGTYSIAVLAQANSIPFFPVVPTSTVDLSLSDGSQIPIEERSPDEVRAPFGARLMPDSWPVRNPAFDVTPHQYVTGIVTEHGIAYPPFTTSLRHMVELSRT